MNEIWKPVPSFSGLLEASSLGRVRRTDRPIVYIDGRKGMIKAGILRGTIDKTGYLTVSFGSQKIGAHRLIAEAFHGTPDEALARITVNHKNGFKRDNRPENIEWASYKENNNHARDTDLNKQNGVNTNLSKYSDQFIQAVRNVHARYKPTYEELGKLFGLRGGHAGQIVKFQTRRKPSP